MAANKIFTGPSTTSIPMGDPRVQRVEFDKSDLGARKSHLKGLGAKNSNSIQHVKGA